jgi:3-hydroxyisobutyrate dehydrogenase-like beta-hydroxyacid dehydrogenase
LATYGDPILHLGGVGAGQIAKLVNNLVFAAQMALASDAFSFVDQLGLDRSMMAQVLERGSGSSRAAVILSGSGFDLGRLGQTAGPLLQKDVGLIVDVAQQQQAVPPPALVGLARAALALLNRDIDAVPRGSSDSGRDY